ncbi:MAG TPA: DUF1592 domain-containing protein [Bryobacteraceae bacterium]|nr:DUF1592 domain-containing protein [Bryobacteraceae bacterium]
MKRLLAVSAASLVEALAQAPGTSPGLPAMMQTYCVTCHGQTGAQAGLAIDKLNPEQVSADADSWEKILRQLRARTMPPVGAPRPDRAAYESVISSLAAALDRGAARNTNRLDDLELASRLAAFLWSGAPDPPLLDDARAGRLKDPAVLERQVRRMLSDSRSKAFVAGLFGPWLELDRLADVKPDPQFFPDFDEPLREAFRRETDLFIESQLHDDRDPLELWSANYTFVNERLARHYGIPNISGPEFRRITWPGPERAGLLGQGSILTINSHTDTSAIMGAPAASPASRGRWIRKHFLGVNPPPPFNNNFSRQKGMPLAKQTRGLPASPCTNCHRNFFPLGYALENFDPLGRWRTEDGGELIDASGAMVDGTAFRGAIELRRALLERSDAFRTTLTERLLAYAVKGQHGTPPEDMPTVRAVLREAAPKDYRWSALIAGIVTRSGSTAGLRASRVRSPAR